MTIYDIGDMARITGAFATATLAPVDPTTVTLNIQRVVIGATTLTLTYTGVSGIVKDAIGNYHYDYLITASGRYRYEWTGTGAAAASEPGEFTVRKNAITGL